MVQTASSPSKFSAADTAYRHTGYATYRPDIDGLRALAILSVVFYHVGPAWLRGGFTGVDIFFVISGYLIGGHIYAELRRGTFSYLRFYQRRVKRIFPALYAVLAFTFIAAFFLLSPAEATQLARDACAALLSVSNILFWGTANYFAGKSELNPLLMTWSLGVEEQFYAVIPMLMALLARFRQKSLLPATLVLCIVSFVCAASLSSRYPMMIFYLLPPRAWELGAGVALAVAELNRKANPPSGAGAQAAGFAGLTLVLAPMFLLSAQSAFLAQALLCPVLGTALLIALPTSWINRRVLPLPVLAFIGKVSYSWYLWHWPLLALLHIVYGAHLSTAASGLAIAVSFVAAVFSWRFIEQPFRRSRREPAGLLLRYSLAGAALLLACGLVWVSRGVPQRFPALATMEATSQDLKADSCLAGSTRDEPNLQPSCYGSSQAGLSVAVWGDSHAAALAPGLRSAAAARGFGFVELAKASCPPLIGATHFIPRVPLLAASCQRFNRRVLELLEADRRIRVVVVAAGWSAPLERTWEDGWLSADLARAADVPLPDANKSLFHDSLTAAVRALRGAGKQVVVFEDVPVFEIDPLRRVRSARIPGRRRLAALLGIQDASDSGFDAPDPNQNAALSDSLLQKAVAELPGVKLVDLRQALCSAPTQCAYRIGENLLYNDSAHLSSYGARYALRNFTLPEADNPIH